MQHILNMVTFNSVTRAGLTFACLHFPLAKPTGCSLCTWGCSMDSPVTTEQAVYGQNCADLYSFQFL